jgi:hypothetical protein
MVWLDDHCGKTTSMLFETHIDARAECKIEFRQGKPKQPIPRQIAQLDELAPNQVAVRSLICRGAEQ